MKRFFFPVMLCLMSGAAQAEILFQDPTGKTLNAAIDNISEQEINDASVPRSSERDFFLGLFYVRGAPEFDIKQDCEKSISFLKNAWEGDVADAGYTLATMYYNGICTDKDIDKARGLGTQAAQEGYILAQRMLGLAYMGKKWEKLYPRDIDKGIYWLSEAGNAGDRESAGQLASIYYEGVEVRQNDKKYFSWLKKGVFNKFEKGNMIGFRPLARAYEKGIGTEVNFVKAYKYYDLYGTAGIEGKQRVAKKMTQEQIDEAIRQSEEWQKENNVEIGGGFIRRAN